MRVSAPTARDPDARWLRRAALIGLTSSLLALVLAGCTSPTAQDGSPSPPASRADTAAADCAPLDLRGPDGEPIDLSGEWIADPQWFSYNGEERTFILQIRDCVWISVTDGAFRGDPRPGQSYLAQFSGRLTPDFLVTGTLVTILHLDAPVGVYGQQGTVFPIRLEINWDGEGHVHLQEVPTALRCLVQTGSVPYCPPPTVLSVAEDQDASPPSAEPAP